MIPVKLTSFVSLAVLLKSVYDDICDAPAHESTALRLKNPTENEAGAFGTVRMFLPTTKEEIEKIGWKALDIILITGDSYIDSPHIGVAVRGPGEDRGRRVEHRVQARHDCGHEGCKHQSSQPRRQETLQ